MNIVNLEGIWSLRHLGQEQQDLVPANVPGDNYSALYAAKVIPDPYYRRNERKVQWVKELDWEYSREFDVPERLLACNSIYLDMESLDTFAVIYINGQKVASAGNMFKRHRIEVKKHLQANANHISIVFKSATKKALQESNIQPLFIPFSPHHKTAPYLNLIRKVQCHGGWDWRTVRKRRFL